MSEKSTASLRAGAAVLGCVLLGFSASAQAAGDLAEGRAKAVQCAVCHGIDGLAKQPLVPNLAGNSEIYLKKQLDAFRAGKRQHEQMTIIAQGLSDQDVADLVAWYSGIKVSVELPADN